MTKALLRSFCSWGRPILTFHIRFAFGGESVVVVRSLVKLQGEAK